jgi:hypothetical protein
MSATSEGFACPSWSAAERRIDPLSPSRWRPLRSSGWSPIEAGATIGLIVTVITIAICVSCLYLRFGFIQNQHIWPMNQGPWRSRDVALPSDSVRVARCCQWSSSKSVMIRPRRHVLMADPTLAGGPRSRPIPPQSTRHTVVESQSDAPPGSTPPGRPRPPGSPTPPPSRRPDEACPTAAASKSTCRPR